MQLSWTSVSKKSKIIFLDKKSIYLNILNHIKFKSEGDKIFAETGVNNDLKIKGYY